MLPDKLRFVDIQEVNIDARATQLELYENAIPLAHDIWRNISNGQWGAIMVTLTNTHYLKFDDEFSAKLDGARDVLITEVRSEINRDKDSLAARIRLLTQWVPVDIINYMIYVACALIDDLNKENYLYGMR